MAASAPSTGTPRSSERRSARTRGAATSARARGESASRKKARSAPAHVVVALSCPDATTAPDSALADGDVITAIHIRGAAEFAPRSTYLKVRDRASFEFAVVSVAAALKIEDGVITAARLAAGGVAPRPWRLHESETALIGRAPGEAAFVTAAELAIEGARPLEKNAFKIPLLRTAVIRVLQTIGALP